MKKILLLSFILLGHLSFAQTVAFQIVTPAASGAVSDANSTVLESAGNATINVNLTRSTATGAITVDVAAVTSSVGGNAVLGTDFNFSTQTLIFPAGSGNNTQSFQVAIVNNNLPEPTRYAVFQLTNAVGATINSSANSNTHILYIKDDDQTPTTPSKAVEFQFTSSYQVGTAGTNSAEIVAHDPATQRLFVVNSLQNRIEILNFSNPASITSIQSIDMSIYGAGVNSVAVRNGLVAVAVEGTTVATATTSVPGKVVFLDTNGTLISQVNVGVQPDMVGFSPDGKTVMTADEGEPNANYSFDPQGSISIVDVSNGAVGLQQSSVTTLNFNAYDSQIATLRSQGIRIYGPGATVSQDFEPEYVTFSADSRKAWVVLQENNAMVVVDVVNKQISSIFPLGLKDHSIAGNAFDASDRVSNNQVIPVNWPVKGMFQPDGIAYFEVAGTPYVVGATEGDSRAWTGGSGLPGPGYTEEIRVADAGYVFNPSNFPNGAILKRGSALGRLQVTNANRNYSTNQFDEIHVLGGRSFAIWNANTGALVFDSGATIEKIVSEDATWGTLFNADHSNNNIKDRSDNKGPEPEGVVTAVIAGKTYAFIGLERIGGVMVFDISNPSAPIFSDYLNSRTIPPVSLGGDRGAEGIVYINASDSPTGTAMILAGNEVSSTVSVYSLKNVTVTAAPVATAASQVSASGFSANWNNVTGATSYIVEYSTDNFATFTTVAANSTSVAITGLSSNTTFSYRVRAVNAFGNSQPSNIINTATVLVAPVASSPLRTFNGFTANWTTVTGASSYQLDVSQDNFATFVSGFNSLSVNGNSLVINTLASNTTYTFRVRAVNANGASANSNVVSVTTFLAAPVATAATSVTTTGFSANWNDVNGAIGYFLDVSTDNFATFVTGYNARAVTATTLAITGLSPNTAYNYRVVASNANGNSPSSNVIAVNTLAQTRVIGLAGTLQFGDVIVGEPAVLKSIAIGNSGNSDLTITGVSAPSGYTVTPTTGTIAPGGSLNVQVSFAPTVAQDYNGNLTVNSNATAGAGTVAITGRGVKITAADDVVTDGLMLYPNPGKGIFWIKSQQVFEHKQTQLTDELGRDFVEVDLKQIDKGIHQIDISHLPNGLYFLKLKVGEQVIMKKIIKVN